MDHTKKLLELFTTIFQGRKPDFARVLSIPAADLDAGKTEAGVLFSRALRPDPAGAETQAAGRQRFPNLQGTVALFADGLARHPDLIDEIFVEPAFVASVNTLDQAIGRYIFVGELFERGGDIGEVLAGAALQKVCDDAVADALARSQDPDAAVRSMFKAAFAETFRAYDDPLRRQQEAQASAARGGKPYTDHIARTHRDQDLSAAVDSYLKDVNRPDERTP